MDCGIQKSHERAVTWLVFSPWKTPSYAVVLTYPWFKVHFAGRSIQLSFGSTVHLLGCSSNVLCRQYHLAETYFRIWHWNPLYSKAVLTNVPHLFQTGWLRRVPVISWRKETRSSWETSTSASRSGAWRLRWRISSKETKFSVSKMYNMQIGRLLIKIYRRYLGYGQLRCTEDTPN